MGHRSCEAMTYPVFAQQMVPAGAPSLWAQLDRASPIVATLCIIALVSVVKWFLSEREEAREPYAKELEATRMWANTEVAAARQERNDAHREVKEMAQDILALYKNRNEAAPPAS